MLHDADHLLPPRFSLELVDTTAQSAALLDQRGQFLHWNDAFERLMGYRQALPPPRWSDFVNPESLASCRAEAEQTFTTHTLFVGELLCRRASDALLWCDTTLLPLPAGAEGERLVLVLLRDSTARRQVETTLSGRETPDRFLLDRIQLGIVVHDASTQILYANHKAAELLGITYDRMLGVGSADPHWVFVDERGQPLAVADYPVSRVLATGASVQGLLVGVRRPTDGALVWALCQAFPVRDAEGQLAEIIVSFTDVTQLKEAERARARSEERLQLVFEATNDALWDLDLATSEAWLSPRFWEMLGYSGREPRLHTTAWLALIHPDERDAVEQRLLTWLTGTTRTYELELRMLHRAGHDVIVLVRGIILRDAQGHAIRIAGTNTDLTARRAVERRLQQSQKLESVGQLAGGVAHDFNNLLAVITGNLELLAEYGLNDRDATQILAEARGAAARGAELTRQLLAFSRRQPLQLRRVDVVPLLHTVAAMLRRLLPASIALEMPVPPSLPAIRADAGLLENALINLAINARDAMGERGHLTITADLVQAPSPELPELAPGDHVRLQVTDTGHGMSREVADRAIEPFFTTKELGQGTGLGLSMVYGFAQQCGGNLLIRSHEGQGTTVSLLFPALQAVPSQPTPPQARTHTRAIPREEVVLVVEDNPSVRLLCLRALATLGFCALAASDGPTALEVFAAAPRVDLLLTDLIMPGGMNGSELAAALRTRDPTLRVVFMSGYHADILSDVQPTADASLLPKPFSIAELALLLDRLLPLPCGD